MAWLFDGPPVVGGLSALEARNALLQADRVRELVDEALVDSNFRITPAIVRELNRIAVVDVVDHPGDFRGEGPCNILGSRHVPPPASDVPRLVIEMCDELAAGDLTGIERAAFALWRLNWIHPFEDGNGRTARAVCYVLACCALRGHLPGRVTLAERICLEPRKYVRCLEEADRAWRRRRLDVSHLAGFLRRLVRAQLRDAIEEGCPPSSVPAPP